MLLYDLESPSEFLVRKPPHKTTTSTPSGKSKGNTSEDMESEAKSTTNGGPPKVSEGD